MPLAADKTVDAKARFDVTSSPAGDGAETDAKYPPPPSPAGVQMELVRLSKVGRAEMPSEAVEAAAAAAAANDGAPKGAWAEETTVAEPSLPPESSKFHKLPSLQHADTVAQADEGHPFQVPS